MRMRRQVGTGKGATRKHPRSALNADGGVCCEGGIDLQEAAEGENSKNDVNKTFHVATIEP